MPQATLAREQKATKTTDTSPRGEFQIEDLDTSKRNIQRLAEVVNKTHIMLNMPMASALLRLFNDPDNFDYDFFMQKLERENARAMFGTHTSLRACLRTIEEIYNFQSKVQKRLY